MADPTAKKESAFSEVWAEAQASWTKAFQQMTQAAGNLFAGRPSAEAQADLQRAWLDAYQKIMGSLSGFPSSIPLRTSLEMMLGAANAFLKLQRAWLQSMENAPAAEMFRISAQSVESLSRAWHDIFENLGKMQLPEPLRQAFLPFGQISQQVLSSWSEAVVNLAGPSRQLVLPWLEAWQRLMGDASGALSSGEGMEAISQFHDTWTSAYRDTLGKLLGIPIIGPTRVTVEKVMKTTDAYYKYIGACIDFSFRVYQPAAAAFEKVTERAREMLSEGLTPDALRDLYNLTLQVFEESFHQLFKSEGFTRGMHLMLEQMLDFRRAYDDLLEALLRETPVVTRSELDEVYAELHELKKEVRRQREQLDDISGGRKVGG